MSYPEQDDSFDTERAALIVFAAFVGLLGFAFLVTLAVLA